MREKDIWVNIHSHWPQVHAIRLENSASFGDPDVNACYDGVDFWLELKIESRRSFVIRPTQLAWIAKRLKAGARNVFIFTHDPDTGVLAVYDPKFLFAPGVITALASALKVSTVGILPVAFTNHKDKQAYNILLHEIIKCCTLK